MKKIWNIASKIITWLVFAVAAFMMVFTIISVSTFDRMDRNILGYKAFIVLTNSMEATDFSAGDLVLSKVVEPATLKEGDIITFQSVNPDSYGKIVTHKIRRLTTDADGNPGFVTYGTTTDTDDETVVTYSFVLGKYQMRIPKVGVFLDFLKTTPGYIVCILIPFLLLIMMQGISSIRLFKQYKQEQLREMKAERDKIDEERQEAQKMMQELMALKAQLAGQSNPDPAPAAEPSAEEKAEEPSEELPEEAPEESTEETSGEASEEPMEETPEQPAEA